MYMGVSTGRVAGDRAGWVHREGAHTVASGGVRCSQQCLDSYPQLAPWGLDCNLATSPRVSDMQRHLHRSVFMTFLMMATHKESREHFISPAVFVGIIYNNFLFDIPKILDLCVLFGKGNETLLHKMIENIFTQQPGYYSDLDETVPTILQVLDTILQKCGLQTEGASYGQPLKLGAQSSPGPMDMSVKDLVDLVLYLCDTYTTLYSFLDIFPPASTTFQKHSFLLRSENIQVFVEDFLQIFTALLQEKRGLTVPGRAWGRKKHSLPPIRSTPAPELSSKACSEREGPEGATGGTEAQQETYSEDYAGGERPRPGE
ncbi:activating signal cointegrator 1 complex subunit 2-like isoform X6 [Polyodon spathula]|uniref:activating signal cointegrator 1 complex subunit 2-like isoform X6 n=1 Tax=Polyodon spathula TaxID=7913 RepID=UPI001B7F3569|nr:activating signal cointegrator 1 complex subunit 2-like isoform X6 [Polyodon spathula]